MEDEHGRSGWGETTLLTGYTSETIEKSWSLACETARQCHGLDASPATTRIASNCAAAPFTRTALTTALEYLSGHDILRQRGTVELLGAINSKGNDTAALESEVESLIADGYRTLKVKVGFDVRRDLDAVRTIQSLVDGRAVLRIDANQGYSRVDGIAFVAGLSPADIELVEQPCDAHDWDAAVAIKHASSVPVMLDESIYGEDDIRRAADLGCADVINS